MANRRAEDYCWGERHWKRANRCLTTDRTIHTDHTHDASRLETVRCTHSCPCSNARSHLSRDVQENIVNILELYESVKAKEFSIIKTCVRHDNQVKFVVKNFHFNGFNVVWRHVAVVRNDWITAANQRDSLKNLISEPFKDWKRFFFAK